jgi:hypothetical protein
MEALLKIRADVQGEGKIGALGKALGGLNDTAKKVSGGLKGALSGLGGIGGVFGALAGAATGAGLLALGKSAIDTADNLRDMSIRTGVSVEQLSRLKTAAEMSGATIDDVGKALTKTAVAIANSSSAASSATARAIAGGTAQVKLSIADQVRLLEQADAQKVATIKSGAERQIQAVRDGEQRQVDAIERAKDQRVAVLERESDQRMREINRRYRQEEKLLNDSFDDAQDAERRKSDEQLNLLEREIDRRYELRRKQIQNDQTLSDAAKDQATQALRDQQDAELTTLRNGFADRAKVRDRFYRDQQEAAQQAIDDRRTAEQEAERAATEAQKRQAEESARIQKAALARASAERIAQIKAAADSQVKAIQDGNKRAQDAYAKLGIALRKADGSQRGAGEVFMDVFDALQKLPTASDRAAAAFDLYGGKLATKLLPLFAMTREEVEKLIPTFTTEFANAADAFNDKQVQLGATIGRLGAAIATVLLPAINPLVDLVSRAADAFTRLPGPVQAVIGSILALAAGFVLLAPAISAIVSVAGALAGLQLGATIAGWLGVIGPAVAGITAGLSGLLATIAGWAGAAGPAIAAVTTAFSGLLAWIGGTLIPGLLAFFSGPVGWTVLAVAAVVAMVALFREPLMQFFSWAGQAMAGWVSSLWQWGEPIRQFWLGLWNQLVQATQASLNAIGGFISWAAQAWWAITYQLFIQPWINIWNLLKGPVMELLQWMSGALSTAFAALTQFAYSLFVQPWVNLWNNVLRQPVTSTIQWLGGIWKGISDTFRRVVAQPISQAWKAVVQALPTAMQAAASFVGRVWTGMVNTVRNAVRGMLLFIANSINSVTGAVNNLIRGFNNLPGPDISLIGRVTVPAFAEGGYVKRATVGLVGEAGPEYIIPASKMQAASERFLSGQRGADVLRPSKISGRTTAAGTTPPAINITTGPVLEFDGQRYVTVQDFERGMRMTAEGVIGRLRTPAARIALGR